MTFKDVIGSDVFVYNKVVVLTDSFGRNGRLSPEEKLNNQIVKDSHVAEIKRRMCLCTSHLFNCK